MKSNIGPILIMSIATLQCIILIINIMTYNKKSHIKRLDYNGNVIKEGDTIVIINNIDLSKSDTIHYYVK